MRRRASQDFNNSPHPAYSSSSNYERPPAATTMQQMNQHATTTTTQPQRPLATPRGRDDHTDLYGYYAASDHAGHHHQVVDDDDHAGGYYAHSASSHTALNMTPQSEHDWNEKGGGYFDNNSAVPSLPPLPHRYNNNHHQQQQTPPSPYYPPPHPSPSHGGGGGYFAGGFYEPDNSNYSRLRRGVMDRREKKQVELTRGHLVVDLDVAHSLSNLGKQSSQYNLERDESAKLRYTAITEDPDDFTRSGYRLRQKLSHRQTELVIVLTMYNEDEALFARTFKSVVKNIQHLHERERSKTWGPDSWKKVVVVVVSDGRGKIDPRTLKMLGLTGCYQDGVMKDTVQGKDVQAHLFEYTTNVVVDKDGQVKAGICPIQIVFCLKETS